MAQQSKMEKMLLHAARMLNSTLDYEELMRLVLELTIKATGAEAALVQRIDKKAPDQGIRYLNSRTGEFRYFKMSQGEGLLGWVAEHHEPQIITDLQNDSRYQRRVESFIDIKPSSAIIVPLIGRGHLIGVVEALNKCDGVFDSNDLDTLMGLANQFAIGINNANLYRDAKREAMERELLYEVGKKLSSTLNLDEALKMICDTLKKVVDFSAIGIFLIDENKGEVSSVYSEGYDSNADQYIKLKVGQGLVGWVAENRDPVIVDDVTKDDRYFAGDPETKSELVAPIEIDNRVIGVINLESPRVKAYDKRSLELLKAFASQAALTIERAKLHDRMLESRRIEEQLSIARHIQLSFIPKSDPEIPGYDVSGVNIPSGEVGGDYYDFIDIVRGQTGIAIADVSGKGIPAALIMASFRASLIAEIRNNYAIRTICRKVNNLLYESLERENYVTAFYGVLDSKNDILTFSNCGHNRPILLRRDGGVELLAEGGLALGIVDDTEYEERPISIRPGDIVLMYTDGVTEVEGADGVQFGEEHLVRLLRANAALSSREIHQALYKEIRNFARPDHVFDDVTMVVVKKLE
jgi:sigma-B regulation protein RsbU (phosphoserine phosphatase)